MKPSVKPAPALFKASKKTENGDQRLGLPSLHQTRKTERMLLSYNKDQCSECPGAAEGLFVAGEGSRLGAHPIRVLNGKQISN